jgi:hypothetical protein
MRRASQPDRVPVDIALAVLHFIPDGDNPYGIVAQLVGGLLRGRPNPLNGL